MVEEDVSGEGFPLRGVENSLRLRFSEGISPQEVPVVFVLGSPRTGSTLTYQALINHFRFNYPTNLLNLSFAQAPVSGTFFERQTGLEDIVSYESSYGKTQGAAGPSEASFVFKEWFGGEHPSETNSRSPLAGQKSIMEQTFAAIHGMTGSVLLFKNAWNCFRIASLSEIFPKALFVWVRRDIGQAARSDLESRCKHGGPETWNSATPQNYLEIQKLPYWEQVVEQQYEYGRCIRSDFSSHCGDRHLEVWYEDLCLSPTKELLRLEEFFHKLGRGSLRKDSETIFTPDLRERTLHEDEDGRRILAYLDSLSEDRIASFCYKR